MYFLRSVVMCCLLSAMGIQTMAGSLPQPSGRVILTVEGALSNTNGDGVARFDREMLEDLSMHLTRTDTPWTEGVIAFEGPLGRRLLDYVGARGQTLIVTALNDYSTEVPLADFYEYDVILALKMDGDYIRIRDKGPIFIVYPFADNPALHTEVIHNRSVWQLKSIRIK
ncbi:molybdopterin-dependent oxidoreductase [Marinobacterium rhizophilum]|uniref:molybdopterin-dependent oxidoreductase n=1 Tax=Marinobacterium rhizophilum TaxID=420402 RepID=UPI00037D58CC|nr:molybdopterin-dependent oxidoreductase [Marinobacterium rhizophilum]